MKENRKCIIKADKIPKVLFIGNGILQLGNSGNSWNDLLKNISNKTDIPNLKDIVPYAMQPEVVCDCDVEEIQRRIRNEFNSLGIFAGKRKKEITIELDKLTLLRKKKEDEISFNTNKMQGFTSISISKKITQNNNDVKKTKAEIDDLNSKLDEEMNKLSDIMNYNEAMTLLKESSIKDVFENKYKGLYLRFFGISRGVITLGNYKNETIKWRILEEKNDKLLLISEEALDTIPYNNEHDDITWETCTLRKWLNSDFIGKAFSLEEQKLLMESRVKASNNPERYTNNENNTYDKIFLLSIDEVEKYFKKNDNRECYPATSASKANKDKDCYSCWWWLRSPGSHGNRAAIVRSDGSVDLFGDIVNSDDPAVRPALWIKL